MSDFHIQVFGQAIDSQNREPNDDPFEGVDDHDWTGAVWDQIIVTDDSGRKRALLSTLEERDGKGNLRWLKSDGSR